MSATAIPVGDPDELVQERAKLDAVRYDKMSASLVITAMADAIRPCPNHECRIKSLRGIVSEIFLELPEDRLMLLGRAARLVNEFVSDKYSTPEPCWNEVKRIYDAAVFGEPSQ